MDAETIQSLILKPPEWMSECHIPEEIPCPLTRSWAEGFEKAVKMQIMPRGLVLWSFNHKFHLGGCRVPVSAKFPLIAIHDDAEAEPMRCGTPGDRAATSPQILDSPPQSVARSTPSTSDEDEEDEEDEYDGDEDEDVPMDVDDVDTAEISSSGTRFSTALSLLSRVAAAAAEASLPPESPSHINENSDSTAQAEPSIIQVAPPQQEPLSARPPLAPRSRNVPRPSSASFVASSASFGVYGAGYGSTITTRSAAKVKREALDVDMWKGDIQQRSAISAPAAAEKKRAQPSRAQRTTAKPACRKSKSPPPQRKKQVRVRTSPVNPEGKSKAHYCKICGQCIYGVKEPLRHVDTVHLHPLAYRCLCEKSYSRVDALSRHMKTTCKDVKLPKGETLPYDFGRHPFDITRFEVLIQDHPVADLMPLDDVPQDLLDIGLPLDEPPALESFLSTSALESGRKRRRPAAPKAKPSASRPSLRDPGTSSPPPISSSVSSSSTRGSSPLTDPPTSCEGSHESEEEYESEEED